jgi:hypothetical protein
MAKGKYVRTKSIKEKIKQGVLKAYKEGRLKPRTGKLSQFLGKNNPAKRLEVRKRITKGLIKAYKEGRKVAPNTGTHLSRKYKEKISKSVSGVKKSKKAIEKGVKTRMENDSYKCSLKTRLKLQKKLSGKNNPNWQGGIGRLPYPFNFNDKLKEEIRKRDNYKCQGKDCGIPEIECDENLTVHHIDYDKDNLSEVNLISLCRGCNTKANFNREYWEEYFTKLMISKISFKKDI